MRCLAEAHKDNGSHCIFDDEIFIFVRHGAHPGLIIELDPHGGQRKRATTLSESMVAVGAGECIFA